MLIHLVTFWTATDKSLWKLQINNNIFNNKVMGSNPIQAWIFLPGLLFTTASVVFITAKIAFIFTSLSTVQIYDFHIFTDVYSPLHGFIWNQHSDQLPVGLLAQLVEHCIRLRVKIPYRPEFFSGLLFTTALFITVKITFIFMSLFAVLIYDLHIFTAQYFW